MSRHEYSPDGVCATDLAFEIDGGIVTRVTFNGGCSGNLQAIARLVEGMPVDEVRRRLKGIDCDGKGTSCADQLAKALDKAMAGRPPSQH